jgi:hypothetical protein
MHIFTDGKLGNWSQRNVSIEVKASCHNAISSLKLHISLLSEEKDIQEDIGVDEKELNFWNSQQSQNTRSLWKRQTKKQVARKQG